MININIIKHDKLLYLIKEYEENIQFLKNAPYYIETLNSYSKYLRCLLKSIDPTLVTELNDRIIFNTELEKKLQQHGNIQSNLEEHNPKISLLKINELLGNENYKAKKLSEIITESKNNSTPTLIIVNNNDVEFIKNEMISGSNHIQTIRYSQLDKFTNLNNPNDYFIIDFAFEGYNDFIKYYNYEFIINLFLYPIEKELYDNCLKKYKSELEQELSSQFREEFTGIKYEPIIADCANLSVSNTIQGILSNATEYYEEDDFNTIKENPEMDTAEKMLYIIEYIGIEHQYEYDSREYVFNEQNKLIKINFIKTGDRIRNYNEELNKNLYSIAEDEDEETFNLIEYYSDLWHNSLNNYYKTNSISIDVLYNQLKKFGFSVQQVTLQNYLDKKVHFPMKKSDLNAIIQLTGDENLNKCKNELLKYKRIYNGIMIALGKNLKEEILIYLQTGELGNIIGGSFKKEMLDHFIETSMPLRTVKNITRKIIEE